MGARLATLCTVEHGTACERAGSSGCGGCNDLRSSGEQRADIAPMAKPGCIAFSSHALAARAHRKRIGADRLCGGSAPGTCARSRIARSARPPRAPQGSRLRRDFHHRGFLVVWAASSRGRSCAQHRGLAQLASGRHARVSRGGVRLGRSANEMGGTTVAGQKGVEVNRAVLGSPS